MEESDGDCHVVIHCIEVGQWAIQDRAKTLQSQGIWKMLAALILVDARRGYGRVNACPNSQFPLGKTDIFPRLAQTRCDHRLTRNRDQAYPPIESY